MANGDTLNPHKNNEIFKVVDSLGGTATEVVTHQYHDLFDDAGTW